MSSTSLKQKAVVATLVVVVLYALVIGWWFMNRDKKMSWCPTKWATAMRSYEKACRRYDEERALIAQRQRWIDAYEAEKQAMPTFDVNKETDTTWQRKIDDVAAKHHIAISQRQAGKEIVADDVLEMPIDVTCEGALESLVKFMHELENTDDGLFDIRSIRLRPNTSKRGYLRISFTLTCAYMRS